jgi:hypothetical protein
MRERVDTPWQNVVVKLMPWRRSTGGEEAES